MNDFTETTDSVLKRLYAGREKLVAFIDESFPNRSIPARRGFYAVTAVIVRSQDLDAVRYDYAETAGFDKWHTTDRFNSGEHEKITEFCQALADAPDPLLLVVEAGEHVVQENLETTRRLCLSTMVRLLHEEYGVELVIYERRRPGVEQENDNKTALGLRKAFPRLIIRDAWSGSEALLWAPDVLAWTMQRRLIEHESWFDPFVDVAKIYNASGDQITGFTRIGPLK